MIFFFQRAFGAAQLLSLQRRHIHVLSGLADKLWVDVHFHRKLLGLFLWLWELIITMIISEAPRFLCRSRTQSSRLTFRAAGVVLPAFLLLVVVACFFSSVSFHLGRSQFGSSICSPQSDELCTLTNYQSGCPSGSQLKF